MNGLTRVQVCARALVLLVLLIVRAAASSPLKVKTRELEGPLPVGRHFLVSLSADKGLCIRSQAAPSQVLWQSRPLQAFLACAQGRVEASEDQGNFLIVDEMPAWSEAQTIEFLELPNHDTVVMRGRLLMESGNQSWPYVLELREEEGRRLGFKVQVSSDEGGASVTHVRLEAQEDAEGVYGFGAQFSYLNMRGQRVPVWVSEQGVGRGLEPLTTYMNDPARHRSGGGPFTTYAPLPFYATPSGRSLFLRNTEYSVFDLTDPSAILIHVASTSTLDAVVLLASSLPEAVTALTAYHGRMDPLPDWVGNGVIVGLQGGTEQVLSRLSSLEAAGVAVAGIWLQDWSGQRDDGFGKRVVWNWEVDSTRYPGWGDMLSQLRSRGIRVLSYINPYLVTNVRAFRPDAQRDLYQEASLLGYLVTSSDGQPYIQTSGSEAFKFGTVDLTNPSAVRWYQDVIRTNMLCSPPTDTDSHAAGCGAGGEGVGVSGWMADFGEYLPADEDVVLWSGAAASRVHNDWPRMWAQLNRQAVRSSGLDGDVVFFMRSSFLRGPAWSRLYWLGDQLTSWDGFDGMASAVTGLLSSGLSGMSMAHSDLGGYTSIAAEIDGTAYNYTRSKELVMRWMELSAFSDAMFRSHEGNRPPSNWQVYSDSDTISHLSRFARLFAALGPYRRRLMGQARDQGWPLVRPMFWHYPEQPQAWQLPPTQFMLGADVVVAPVLSPNATSVDLYLPSGRWQSLFDCQELQGGRWLSGWPAPLGSPAVFVALGSQVQAELEQARASIPGGMVSCDAARQSSSSSSSSMEGGGWVGLGDSSRAAEGGGAVKAQPGRLPGWPALLGMAMVLAPSAVVTVKALFWLCCSMPRKMARDQQRQPVYTSLEMSEAAAEALEAAQAPQ